MPDLVDFCVTKQTHRLGIFRETPDEQITLEIPLKTEIDVEASVENITKAIQQPAWQATPNRNEQY
jgi:hypothetical protein